MVLTIFNRNKRIDSKKPNVPIIIDSIDFDIYQLGTVLIPQGTDKYRLYMPTLKNYFHRVILNAKKGQYVDHINGNPLDNRRCNLRLVSNADNCKNTTSHKDSKYSNYKGVTYWSHIAGRNNRWVASIKVGTIKRKQYFSSEIQAALKYNEWALELQGEFCVLNKIDTWKKDLKFGNEMEEFFFLQFREKLIRTDGLKSDFILKQSNDGIQLKADRRKSSETGNLFIEKYSNKHLKSPGGPYKAILDGSKYFIYYFRLTNDYFMYKTIDIITFIKDNETNIKYIEVNSVKSNASGFLIKQRDLQHLQLDLDRIT